MSKSSQSKSLLDLPWQQDLVTKINVLGQDHRETDVLRQPSPPSPSSLSPSSFLHQMKKKYDIVIYQNKKFGGKKLLRRWACFFKDPPYL